eukprot:2431108-Amphidinium_carterae.1
MRCTLFCSVASLTNQSVELNEARQDSEIPPPTVTPPQGLAFGKLPCLPLRQSYGRQHDKEGI